ncbi:AN1-type zinc finger protein 6 isoform X2 [Scleropages formosus]|uniref:AN1-type zinc finger protein 6 isoform X2 n=1 Tax=Scleropages formosus TaxID=113540 RepID=UPI000878B080|nr:AN1-type zinc finger protein 6 isoform X2 [Scleropages formosus]
MTSQTFKPQEDMAQETNQTQVPMLCATGCGFYGNPRTNGMCSVCYKDFLQRQNSNGRVSPPASVSGVGESLPTQCAESSVSQVSPVFAQTDAPLEQSSAVSRPALLSQALLTHSEECDSTGDKEVLKTEELKAVVTENSDQARVEGQEISFDKPKQKRNRCFTCRKKVGLTGFDCRCGNIFCGIHRYSDVHNCTFDYKTDAAERIRKENPVVVGEKIQKI